jgi:outer membrane protein OmpA-like peptidoglycan-associated protein
MINNRVGVMTSISYDYIDVYNSNINTNYWRTSVEGVVNVGDLLRFDTWTKRIGLLIHGGAGFSHLWVKKELRPIDPADPLFKGIDDMINWTFGATPQFKINEHISLNADLRFTFHTRQSYRWDMNQTNYLNTPIDGLIVNTSIGASYYFGKNKEHADWTPTVYGAASTDNDKYEAYEQRIKELEGQLADDDNDGVPNARDLEPGTAEDAIVDSKGRTLNDKDGDKVPDDVDMCPEVKGLYSDNGCPDSDRDGVDDARDKCPDVPGVITNSGCPEITDKVHAVMVKALKGVQFETGKAVLLTKSFRVLDAVVDVMKEYPEYYLEINGHTDNVGDDQANLILSKDRAQAVMTYLVQKGIFAGRMRAEGFGETQPKDTNDTDAGRAINRRVEFNIVFE